MIQNYFIVNGEKYYSGTVIKVKYRGIISEATFCCYMIEYQKYVFKIDSCKYLFNDTMFYNSLIEVTDKKSNNVEIPVKRKMQDIEIPGLFIGWVWYIFLMAISTIFYGRVGLWILISIVFFNWRSKKIKEEGTYVEWH